MATAVVQRSALERQMIGGIAEISACVLALPEHRRATLFELIDTDLTRSLDLLEAEINLYRRNGGSSAAPITAQAETH